MLNEVVSKPSLYPTFVVIARRSQTITAIPGDFDAQGFHSKFPKDRHQSRMRAACRDDENVGDVNGYKFPKDRHAFARYDESGAGWITE